MKHQGKYWNKTMFTFILSGFIFVGCSDASHVDRVGPCATQAAAGSTRIQFLSQAETESRRQEAQAWIQSWRSGYQIMSEEKVNGQVILNVSKNSVPGSETAPPPSSLPSGGGLSAGESQTSPGGSSKSTGNTVQVIQPNLNGYIEGDGVPNSVDSVDKYLEFIASPSSFGC